MITGLIKKGFSVLSNPNREFDNLNNRTLESVVLDYSTLLVISAIVTGLSSLVYSIFWALYLDLFLNIDIQYTIIDIYPPVIHDITVSPSPAQVQDTLNMKVNATDNVNISKVNASIEGSSSDLSYNATSRLYEGTLTAPSTAGIYPINVTTIDWVNLTTTSAVIITVNSTNAELIVYSDYIVFNSTEPEENYAVEINATILNKGGNDANNFNIELLIDNNSIANNTISVSANSNTTTSFEWNSSWGNHTVMIKADTNSIINEDNETNNNATKNLFVLDITPPAINEITTNDISEGGNLIIKVNATDNAGIDTVTALINGTSLILSFNATSSLYENSTTNVSAGTHTLTITATDINNLVSSKQALVIVNSVNADLLLNPRDISFSQQILKDGESTIIYANISNDGGTDTNNFSVELLIDDISQQNNSLSVLTNSKNLTQFTWTASYGNHTLTFKVDSLNNISESNESNNEINKTVSVIDATPPTINEVIVPASVYENSDLTIKANVTDNFNVSAVTGDINGNRLTFVYNSTSGLYENLSTALTAGTYNLTINATDTSGLKAETQQILTIYESGADLTIDYVDLTFNPTTSNITENSILTINATVHNNGGTDANNFKVELLIDGSSESNNTLSVKKASTNLTQFTWTAVYDYHNLTIRLDPDNTIIESNKTNNEYNKTIFVLDATPPPILNLTAAPSNWTNETIVNISWQDVTDNNGIARYEYQIDYGGFTNNNLETSFTTPSQTDGVHTVYARAIDSPGNLGNLDNISIYIDTTSPNTPVIREWHSGKNWTQHNTPYLSWTDPGDKGSGITKFKISVDNGSEINLDYNLTYHSSNLTTGSHTFKVKAYDALSQNSSFSNIITVYIDTTKPGKVNVTSKTHPDNNSWYAINALFFNLTPPLDDSGINGYYYIVDKTENTTPDIMSLWTTNTSLNITDMGGGASYGTNESNATNVTGIPDGEWYFHVIAKDNVGNLGENTAHYKLKIDTTAPGIGNLTPANNSNIDDKTPTIIAEYTDLAAGVNVSAIKLYLDDNEASPNTKNETTTIYTTSTLSIGKHNTTIYLADNLSNANNITWLFNITSQSPVINKIECYNSTAWVDCSNIAYDTNLSQLRVNCTDSNEDNTNATFKLTNIPDNKTLMNVNTNISNNGLWIYNDSYVVIEDSGGFNLTVACIDEESNTITNSTNWTVPWGYLKPYIITNSTNATKNELFNYSAGVECMQGECGDVNISADPMQLYTKEERTILYAEPPDTSPDKTITINLKYKSGTQWDEDDNGIEYLDGIVDLTVENTQFSWAVDETKLCTKWETYSVDNKASTIICHGAAQCCNFIGLEPSRDSWNEIFYSNYEKYGAAYNNTIAAIVIYYDVNLSIENPYSDIAYSDLADLSVKFIEKPVTTVFTRIINNFKDKITAIRGTIVILGATLTGENESPVPFKPISLYANETFIETKETDILGEVIFEWNTTPFIPADYLLNLTFAGQQTIGQQTIKYMPSYNFTFVELMPANITFTEAIKDKDGNNISSSTEIIDPVTKEIIQQENIVEGKYDVNINLDNHLITAIKLGEADLTAETKEMMQIDDMPDDVEKTNNWEELYAINPVVNFTQGTVTLTAKGHLLMKCKEWDFNSRTCNGNWSRIMSLTPGQEYALTITPDDPGFGEINISDAEHLDSNRNFIVNIYEEVKAIDNIAYTIPENEFARVYFERNLTSDNFIDIYTNNSVAGAIEVYEKDSGVIIGYADDILQGAYYIGLNHTGNQSVFDMKSIGNITYDYIHDAISSTSFNIAADSIAIGENTTINSVFGTTANWDGSVFVETTLDERITNACGSNQIKLTSCGTTGGQGECVCQANFTVFCTVADETTNVTWTAEGCAAGTREYRIGWEGDSYANGTNTDNLTVNKATGILNASVNATNVYTGSEVMINCSANYPNLNLNLTENGAAIYNSSGANISIVRQYNSTGNFNITCFALSHQNYTANQTDTLWVNVTAAPEFYCDGALNNSANAFFKISSNVICSNESITLGSNSDIEIMNNGNLTIKEGTILTFTMTADGGSYIKKNQTGGLWIYNSTITSDNSAYEYDFWVFGSGNNDNFTLQNSKIIGAGYSPPVSSQGIQLYNISDVVIEGNNISFGVYGLYLLYSANNNIANNIIYNTSSTGIYTRSSINNTLTYNTVYNTQGTFGYGIRVSEFSNNTLLRFNTIYNANRYGLLIDALSSNNQIVNNTIYDASDHGLYLSRSSDNSIKNNTIRNNRANIYIYASGGYSGGNIIKNNIIANSGSGYDNIYIDGLLDSSGAGNNVIENNIISNSARYGIYIYRYSENNTVHNNTISNNSIGIYVTTNNNLIYFNNISYNTDALAYDNGNNSWNSSNGGNSWYDIPNLDIVDSDNDGFGDSGAQYPYNATFGNVSGNVVDYTPVIPRTMPIISSIAINLAEPVINNSINCEAAITDPNDDPIIWANFTVYYPNGTAALDNSNGTQNGDIWTSSNVTASIDGVWNCSITASDDKNNVSASSLTFPVIEQKEIISTTAGATPFYTISSNPQTCSDLKKGLTCNITWQVNATGTIGGRWEFYSIYNIINYSAYVADNESERINVTIRE